MTGHTISLSELALELGDRIKRVQESDLDTLYPAQGRVCKTTDTDTVFWGTGSGWVSVPESAELGAASINASEVSSDDQPVRTVHLNYVTGGDGSQTDPYQLDASVLDAYYGEVELGRGYFVGSGLSPDTSVDWQSFALYLNGTGNGPRGTTLMESQPDLVDPLFDLSYGADSGNFGGLANMTVWGYSEYDSSTESWSRLSESTVPLIDTSGNGYDHLFENLIVRHGIDSHGISGGGSGIRYQNLWVEACDIGINHTSGTRAKFDNLHITGHQQEGLSVSGQYNQVSNATAWNNGVGVFFNSARGQITNVNAHGNDAENIMLGSSYQTASNLYSENAGIHGIEINASGDVSLSNAYIEGSGSINLRVRNGNGVKINNVLSKSAGSHGVHVHSDSSNVLLSEIALQGTFSGGDGLRIDANGTVIDGVAVDATFEGSYEPLNINGDDVVINAPGLTWADNRGSGLRTVLNGVGLNAGDPSVEGEWNNNGREGVHVHDTTNNVLYHYVNGSWV